MPSYRLQELYHDLREGIPAINPDEINKDVWVDPDATDFGTALEEAVAAAPTGGVVAVPPVEYPECSGALVDKPVAILGDAPGNRKGTRFKPIINKTTDAPCIEGAASTGLHIEGLTFDAEGFADTTDAVKVRAASYIANIVGNYIGQYVVHLAQEGTNDNLNLSTVLNVSGQHGDSDVVHAENYTADNNNINSIQVHVNDHFNNAGWAINTGTNDSNGSQFVVNTIQGTDTLGGIRFNSQRCYGEVWRHEGAGPVCEFVEPFNKCLNYYDNSGNGATWTNPNCVFEQIGSNGHYAETRYGGHSFAGSAVIAENGTVQYGQNGARIYVDSNGELIAEDEAGNPTQLT